MGGDGLGGLAFAILALMALMLVGLALDFGGVGLFIAKRIGWTGWRRTALVAGLALVGMAGGWLWANATFYESKFDPPPELRIRVAGRFAERWAILLEDPARGAPLVWSGGTMPFDAPVAEIAMPPGGVLRVRDFGQAQGRGDLTVVWSDGSRSMGRGMGPSPVELGARGYLAISRDPADATGPGADLPQGADLVAYVRARERR